MHSTLSGIQQSSHARLNGIPKIIGYNRSQKVTDKHIAMKGTKPSTSDARDGFFGATDPVSIPQLWLGPLALSRRTK